MDPLLAALVIGGIIVATTVIGVIWKARDGRVRAVQGPRVDIADTEFATWPERATLLQFSSEMCARCPGTRRFLQDVASSHDEVTHTEIDLTHRADLASKYDVTQTPTVLVLDGYGRIRARVAGAPKAEQFKHTLDEILRSPRDDYDI